MEYSWVKATVVSVCLRILFVTLQNTNITAENGVVGVVDVYHIEGDCFCSLGTPFAERDVQLYFAEGLYSFAFETDVRVL
jgi:hypothetical protein